MSQDTKDTQEMQEQRAAEARAGTRVRKIGPHCSVIPHQEMPAYLVNESMRRKREEMIALTFDFKNGEPSKQLRTAMELAGISPMWLVEEAPVPRSDDGYGTVVYLPTKYEKVRAYGLEYDDPCWIAERGPHAKARRDMASEMGLYPAWTYRDTPEYRPADADFHERKWRCACQYGTQWCVRPSHLVVGTFRGKRRL